MKYPVNSISKNKTIKTNKAGNIAANGTQGGIRSDRLKFVLLS